MDDKPFVCVHEGCLMAFTNEDHLAVHQKKHGMVLNFELISKNNTYADQTPTPTRFIRNCEEVGLFQDLQNVNPFEETFKKALEQPSYITNIPPTSNDESTLHTPHILPHINREKLVPQPILVKPSFVDALEIHSSEEEVDLAEKPPPPKSKRKTKPSINIYDKNLPPDVLRREMNRIAQKRLRVRRKELGQELELRMERVMDNNERLQLENQELRAEVTHLRNFLSRHKDCKFDNVELNKSSPEDRVIKPKPDHKNVVYTLPKIMAGDIVVLNNIAQSTKSNMNVIQTVQFTDRTKQ